MNIPNDLIFANSPAPPADGVCLFDFVFGLVGFIVTAGEPFVFVGVVIALLYWWCIGMQQLRQTETESREREEARWSRLYDKIDRLN